MPQGGSGGDKNSQRAVALITSAGVVLAAVITGAFTLFSHGSGSSAGIQASSGSSSTTASAGRTGSPSPSALSPSPVPPGTPGSARISSVTSASGGSCLGETVKVPIDISGLASADREVWLMAIVMTGTPIHPVYYAKQELVNALGVQIATIQFIGSAIGSVRELVVVSSSSISFSWLRQNLANHGIAAWDIKRVKLPAGVSEISSHYRETRQC